LRNEEKKLRIHPPSDAWTGHGHREINPLVLSELTPDGENLSGKKNMIDNPCDIA
jgi:hypothetical protein